jgi:hypothetical protein
MNDLRAAAQQALEAYDRGLPVTAATAMGKLRSALAQQEQEADYPEEKLQAVAEYVSNQYHVWYGVAASDIEEVLRQSVRCGLVSNPPRRETEQEPVALFTKYGPPTMRDRDFWSAGYAAGAARAVEAALKERNT